MSPEIEQPKERICANCKHYGWRHEPNVWHWAYCFKKQKLFPESIPKPGEKKGCEEWA
jgi:hypothetical protein